MKTLKTIKPVIFYLALFFFFSCKSITIEKVANEIVIVNNLNKNNSFYFLDESLLNKEIVLLGEATHGDGKTFEIKSKLVEYLVKEKGYDTFAFEARDFFEIEFINGNSFLEGVLDDALKQNWVRRWSPWGPSKEIESLVALFSNNKLNYIGLETFSLNSYPSDQSFIYIKNRLDSLSLSSYSSKIWDNLSEIRKKMISYKDSVSEQEFESYIKTLEVLYQEISDTAYQENLFLLQTIENTITATKIDRFASPSTTDEKLDEFIRLRDAQMAKNLIWYKIRNPQSKIIGWMANFHAAKELRGVDFADGDISRYSKFTVFGEHIAKKHGELVFSLAFTSSRGTSKMPYNMESVEEVKINAPENSLEKKLDLKNVNYGYIDFNELKKRKPRLKESKFNSIMLGYTNQAGNWLDVFDGLLYIRENNIATPINQ